jgi:hypothetical protein
LQQMGVKMPLSFHGHHRHLGDVCPQCEHASSFALIDSSRSAAAFSNH